MTFQPFKLESISSEPINFGENVSVTIKRNGDMVNVSPLCYEINRRYDELMREYYSLPTSEEREEFLSKFIKVINVNPDISQYFSLIEIEETFKCK